MEKAVDSRVEVPVDLPVDSTKRQEIERCINSMNESERRAGEFLIAFYQATPERQQQVIEMLKEYGCL